MLCKITMRAALAHVLGIIGILGATFAGAEPKFALEKLGDGIGRVTAGVAAGPYKVKASEMGAIVLCVQTDQLIDTTALGEDHFVRLDFGGAKLSQGLGDDPITLLEPLADDE